MKVCVKKPVFTDGSAINSIANREPAVHIQYPDGSKQHTYATRVLLQNAFLIAAYPFWQPLQETKLPCLEHTLHPLYLVMLRWCWLSKGIAVIRFCMKWRAFLHTGQPVLPLFTLMSTPYYGMDFGAFPSCEKRFLVCHDGGDCALYKVIGFAFPVCDLEQPLFRHLASYAHILLSLLTSRVIIIIRMLL